MISTQTNTNPKKIFFQSLGCVKNLVDAEVMLGITQKHDYKIVTEPSDASVIVVNTCSFINDSKKESINAIIEMAQHKEKGTCKRLIVSGCLPQRYKADLKVSFPEVDAFVGTGQYNQILEFIDGKADEEAGFKHPKYIHNENTPRINTQPFYRAYLKVSEGCIKSCAFCIIPKIRGTLRSRTIESLVNEATNLVEAGAVELNLIAQDLTDYGRDLRDGTNLVGLLKALAKVEKLKWIRLLYVYPEELSDDLIELIATEDKICKYIDTPIQHINNRMLHLMNRKVTRKQIEERLLKLKARVPQISFRSNVIVGYPGETEAEFNELKEFVRQFNFDYLGVFAYSHEENTASFLLPEQLDEETKQRRREELLAVQQEASKENLKKYIGKTIPVLLEGPSEESELLWAGRYEGQAPDVDGNVLITDGPVGQGKIHNVLIEETMEYDLIGRVVN